MNTFRSRFLPSFTVAMLLAAATAASAQTAITPPTGDVTVRRGGEREFTLGGSGSSNRDFDSSNGGVSFSYGQYLNETNLLVLRQSINYSNPSTPGASQSWYGATRLAFDHHLTARGAFRPFVGANIGGVYGDSVRDTFAAGLEVGGKYYVQPRTFIYAIVEYGWFFRKARSLDDTFDDGAFNWGVGIGFNF
jgi:hypothetical protein